jgi:Putative Ig domain
LTSPAARTATQYDAPLGTTPYHWRVVNGALPSGLTLRPDGTLSGMADKHGVYHFTVRVRDSSHPHMVAVQALKLVVKRH